MAQGIVEIDGRMIATPVQRELRKIAADLRRWRLLRRLMACWVALGLLAVVLSAVFYFTGFAVPFAAPLLVLAGLGIAALVWRERDEEQLLREAARQIEQDDPQLNSLLLAALEQSPDPETGRLSFLQLRVIREALDANRRSPWSEKMLRHVRFAQAVHCVALAFFLAAVWSVAMARGNSAARSLRLAAGGLDISPGNVEVERGSSLAIMARFPDDAIPAKVSLTIQKAGGSTQTIDLMRSLGDPLFGGTLPEVTENLTYTVSYEGKKSPAYQVTVFDYPELTGSDAQLDYPAYTKLEPKVFQDTRRISAVEQTKVDYSYRFNKPLARAELVNRDGRKIAITNEPSGTWKSHFTLQESGTYSLVLRDEAGRTNKLPMEFHFTALTNAEPKLKFLAPRGDQRVSPLAEVEFVAEVEDDFGLQGYGIAYQVADRDAGVMLTLSQAGTNYLGKQSFRQTVAFETLGLEPGDLVTYYLWADDTGPDGTVRRSASDIYFVDIRPFDEIFREGQGDASSQSEQQQQQQGNQSPSQQLAELQKEVVSATWNLQRRVSGNLPTKQFKSDAEVIEESESEALNMLQQIKSRMSGGSERDTRLVANVEADLKKAIGNLQEAAENGSKESLGPALAAEKAAYQGILRMQAREFEVNRSRQQGGGGGGSNANQRQLDELEFNQEENRYESESQASAMPQGEQRETLQVLNRLKELARRQEDMSERLKELQAALNEAKTEQEKEELQRQLKRLQEEQQQIVEDLDEVRQRMSRPENQSRMAETQQQLEQTRQQARESAQEMREGDVGQALSSSTRAERDLKEMSDKLRKSTSKQFSDEMRRMRDQARDLEKREQQIAEKLDRMKEGPQQRPLSETGPRQELLDQLNQQRNTLTNLLQNMRDVTEKAEASEPLLSRQLYDTIRKSSQTQPEKALELATQLVERNFLPDAEKIEERAGQAVKEIKTGVEKAAQDLLGDDAAALRAASAELDKLADKLEQEIASQSGVGTNSLAGAGQPSDQASTNRVAGGGGRGGERREQNESGERQPGTGEANDGQREPGEGGLAGNSRGERQPENAERSGQAGQQGQGEGQPGNGQGERQVAQNNSEQPGQRGQGQGEGQAGQPGEGQGEGDQAGGQPSPGNRGGARGGDGNRGNRLASNFGGNRGGRTPGGGFEGPLTGTDFTQWADRLRDVEEMLEPAELREDAARVLDRARAIRGEYKRHAQPPQWDLVRHEVLQPMRVLQTRISEELARRQSTTPLGPIDRDPVPAKFTELVSKYYENLGKTGGTTNAPVTR